MPLPTMVAIPAEVFLFPPFPSPCCLARRVGGQRLRLRHRSATPSGAVWLLYGVQPKGARHSLTPGRCKGKAHRLEHLGMLGTGCWSRASGRTKAWMTTAPNAANLFGNCSSPQASNPPTAPETGPTKGERPGPADPDIPRRPVLLL